MVLAGMAGKKEIIEREVAEIDLFIINTVRSFRVQKDLSQLELSIAIGMSEGFVGKVENPRLRDKYNPRHLNLLARALGCSPRDFLPEKPLPLDIVKLKLKPVKQSFPNKGKQNYEIIKKTPVKQKMKD